MEWGRKANKVFCILVLLNPIIFIVTGIVGGFGDRYNNKQRSPTFLLAIPIVV
jgi:hypothetical protein